MKNLNLLPIIFILTVLFIVGCNKEDSQAIQLPDSKVAGTITEDSTATEGVFSNGDLVGLYTGIVIYHDSLRVGYRGGEEGLHFRHDTADCTIQVSQVGADSIMLTRPYWSKTIAMNDDLHFSEGYDYYDGFQTYDLLFSAFPHDSLNIENKIIYETNYRLGYNKYTFKLRRE